MTVTGTQSWNPTYSASAQTKTITAASNAKGTVSYTIKSQPSGSYFSISGTTVTMKASTPAGSYTVKIRATAAGNTNYNSGYKDITMTVTVSQATNTITITKKTYTWDGNGKSTTATATSGTPSITYYSDSSCATQTTTTNATSAGGTPKIAGTYYAKATVAASTNYLAGNSGCKEAVVISQATPTVSLTAKTGTWSGSVITANTATVSPNSSPSITYTYYTDSSCATKTSTSHGASAAGGAPSLGGQYYVKASAAAVTGKTNAATSSCVSHKINAATPTVTLTAKSGLKWTGSAQGANTASVSPNSSPTITYTYYTNSSCTTGATTTTPKLARQY
jgi:mucin-2